MLKTPEVIKWVETFMCRGGVDCILQLYFQVTDVKRVSNVHLLIMTLLLRVLHKLLCFDIYYLQWQYTIQSPIYSISENLPPGVVLSTFDSYEFVSTLMTNVQKFSHDSLVVHTLTLIFSLVVSSNVSISEIKVQWLTMIRNICLKNDSRLSSCRVILRQCVILLLKACNNVKEEISTDDAYRAVSIYEFVVQSLLQTLLVCPSTPEDDTPTACVYKQHIKNNSIYFVSEVYSLVAVVVVLHYRIERYKMERPAIAEFFEQYHDDTYINTKRLEIIFVRLLMTHNSTESFHSSESDDALQGMLRICAIHHCSFYVS